MLALEAAVLTNPEFATLHEEAHAPQVATFTWRSLRTRTTF